MLLEKIEFKSYNFNETKDILYERQKAAFVPGSWDYDAFEGIIRKTYNVKDIRTGLFLMKTAGEIATNRNAPKINTEDVNIAMKRLEDSISQNLL